MADLNPDTGKPVQLADPPATDAPSEETEMPVEVAPTPVGRLPVNFTMDELAALNLATRMTEYAGQNLQAVWVPIRDKYQLVDGTVYDRATGEVKPPSSDPKPQDG
jgi:hypothetical protein